jgi:hypothetical protein
MQVSFSRLLYIFFSTLFLLSMQLQKHYKTRKSNKNFTLAFKFSHDKNENPKIECVNKFSLNLLSLFKCASLFLRVE